MDRLTKRDNGGNAVMACENCEKYRESCCSLHHCRNALIKKLAAYEDTCLSPDEIKLNMDGLDEYHKSEAKGQLVILPCKVGDTVFVVEGGSHSIYKSRVDSITLNNKGLWLDGTYNHFGLVYFSGEIGGNVFLTREEAEAARREVEEK